MENNSGKVAILMATYRQLIMVASTLNNSLILF